LFIAIYTVVLISCRPL